MRGTLGIVCILPPLFSSIIIISIAAVMVTLAAFVPRDPFYQLTIALCFVGILVATILVFSLRPKSKGQPVGTLEAYLKFIYGCFLKPHTGDGSGSQQDALVRIS